jgi:D-glycero-alpha-D-manno-heptose 1-phosphate guanylyltransferase
VTTAVILAGGLGTRLRGVVPDLPKPMAPINGRPFIEHQMDYWIAQGVGRFVVSVGYRHEAFTGYFGSTYRGAALEFVIEPSPLGTGGGLLLALDRARIEVPFLLLNGDTYFAVDLKALVEFSSMNDADWSFSLFRAQESGRYMGMEVASDGRIVALKSSAGRPGGLANGGVYWVNPRALCGQFPAGDKISLEDDIFPSALAAGQRVYGKAFDGTFIDIGVPDDYHRASHLLATTGPLGS